MLGKGDNQAIREINRSIILDLVRRAGRVSRTELARRSKLTKPTVSTIIDEFIGEELCARSGWANRSRAGPAGRLLEFNDASAAYLGIHFGVRATRIAVADARGVIRVVRGRPSLRNAPARVGKVVRSMVNEALQAAKIPRARVAAAGATVPGLVDQESGVCVLAPNLAWQTCPARGLQDELRMPVVVNNITQASAVAEGRVGAARGVRSYVWLYVGSGVGAGIVINGRLFHGQSGFSGEIGHCPVSETGHCAGGGRRGCLETVASTMALLRAAEDAIEGKQGTQFVTRGRTTGRGRDRGGGGRRRRGRQAHPGPVERAFGPGHLVPAQHSQSGDDRARRSGDRSGRALLARGPRLGRTPCSVATRSGHSSLDPRRSSRADRLGVAGHGEHRALLPNRGQPRWSCAGGDGTVADRHRGVQSRGELDQSIEPDVTRNMNG